MSPGAGRHLFFINVRLASLREFIGGLTMKQRKNIVKQVRNKDVPFRNVPSTLLLVIVPD